jgi:hypothetical protein
MNKNLQPNRRWPWSRSTRPWLVATVLAAMAPTSYAQVLLDAGTAQFTTEAFANFTAGDDAGGNAPGAAADNSRFDGGARLLSRFNLEQGPDIGIRVAVQATDDELRLTEASVLLFGGNGRLEIGERMGLPDVLTGYAPNNFQFTSAEFGPASGPSLDPAGRLQTVFLPDALATQINPLVSLGGTAALFDDQSTKILYVSPKKDGWLAGVSYAQNADDAAIGELLQAGVTHETYSQQNVLRWGATYAYGRAGDAEGSMRDLSSVGAGVSITLDDALTFGFSASYDGRSQLPSTASGAFASAAWGAIASVNYNTGPWTLGTYYQYASAEGSPLVSRDDRLAAFEAGASYRFTTKLRLYGAWYRFDFDDDDRSTSGLSEVGNVFVFGLRVTL